MDKLLDNAQNLVGKLQAKGTDTPNYIFYSAIIDITPPHYLGTCTTYEAGVCAQTLSGVKIVYKPLALINELRREFNNYRLSHPNAHDMRKGSSTLVPREKPAQAKTEHKTSAERTAKTGHFACAAAAAPYSKEKTDCSKQMKCFNCNEVGHTTPLALRLGLRSPKRP